MSSTDVRNYEPTDEEVQHFEHAIYAAYFISTIKHTGKGGPLEFMPVGAKTKAEFLKRSDNPIQRYEDISVSAMWHGFKVGLMFRDGNGQ